MVREVAPLPDPTSYFSQSVKVYTTRVALDRMIPGLRPGMTGQARIQCGRHTIARTVVEKALRFVRTEFWW